MSVVTKFVSRCRRMLVLPVLFSTKSSVFLKFFRGTELDLALITDGPLCSLEGVLNHEQASKRFYPD
jgi:hypothetical protein